MFNWFTQKQSPNSPSRLMNTPPQGGSGWQPMSQLSSENTEDQTRRYTTPSSVPSGRHINDKFFGNMMYEVNEVSGMSMFPPQHSLKRSTLLTLLNLGSITSNVSRLSFIPPYRTATMTKKTLAAVSPILDRQSRSAVIVYWLKTHSITPSLTTSH